ncbi:hypothetical protein ACQF36_26080 [Streptomyces sp. Marseille-Q5077]
MSLPVPADLSLASFDNCFFTKIRHLLNQAERSRRSPMRSS